MFAESTRAIRTMISRSARARVPRRTVASRQPRSARIRPLTECRRCEHCGKLDGAVVQQAFDEASGIAVIAVVGLLRRRIRGIDAFLLTAHLIGS